MSLKTYRLGSVSVLYSDGVRPAYSIHESVYQHPESEFEVIKRETEGRQTNEFCYSYMSDDEEKGFISGHYHSSEIFHIDRVENPTDNFSNVLCLPIVLSLMEYDLKAQGVTRITAFTSDRLANIATKYGFESKGWVVFDEAVRIPGKDITIVKEI